MVVTSYFPIPTISGGRKRLLRLLEAMERAGALPHILTFEHSDIGIADAVRRGWTVETFDPPVGSLPHRARQHMRRDPAPTSRVLERRLAVLSARSAFVQFEEIGALQYLPRVPNPVPTVASSYNVDSEVRSTVAQTNGVARIRSRYQRGRMRSTERQAARHAEAVLTVSAHDREYFVGAGGKHVLLTPNGVDDDLLMLSPEPSEAATVLFFGSFRWQPNADGLKRFLAECWPDILLRRQNARLCVAGPGTREGLSATADALQGVELLGVVPDLREAIGRARLVIAPVWEGGGTRLKVLEALAAARPVVGTSVAVEQIGFEHGEHGLVADDPRGLSDHIVHLLDDPAQSQRLALTGRELARQYRWSATTRPAEDLYRQWVEQARAGVRST